MGAPGAIDPLSGRPVRVYPDAMRALKTLLIAGALAAALPAQQNDFAGIVVRVDGITPVPNMARSLCGDTFSCTPLTIAGVRGDTVQFFVTGTFNDPYILFATLDTNNVGCVPLMVTNLVNNLILLPGPTLFTLSVGLTSVSDNGRCNGGANPLTSLFTIPMSIQPGSFAMQAIAGSPLSSGGMGFSFTRAVVVSWQ